jgi:hypothetical protein
MEMLTWWKNSQQIGIVSEEKLLPLLTLTVLSGYESDVARYRQSVATIQKLKAQAKDAEDADNGMDGIDESEDEYDVRMKREERITKLEDQFDTKPGMLYMSDELRIVDRNVDQNAEKLKTTLALTESLGSDLLDVVNSYIIGIPVITVFVEKKLPQYKAKQNQARWYRVGRIDWRYDRLHLAISPTMSYSSSLLSPDNLEMVLGKANSIYQQPENSMNWELISHCMLCGKGLKATDSKKCKLGPACQQKLKMNQEGVKEYSKELESIAEQSKSLIALFKIAIQKKEFRRKKRRKDERARDRALERRRELHGIGYGH